MKYTVNNIGVYFYKLGISAKDAATIISAVNTSEHICHREAAILDDIGSIQTTSQSGFRTAEIFDRNGDGFQIIIEPGNNHKIGEITN